jgi:C-terminal processing protease CtpA/Prc
MIKLLFAFLILTQFAFARSLTLEQKMSDLNELVGQIQSMYGPLVYKHAVRGLNVEDLRSRYVEAIKNTKTNAEFYYLMVRFVAEFNDSHFRATLPTDYTTSLGFNTDLIQNKVVIDEINRATLPEAKFPFSKGDEIISMNGKPVGEVLKELIPYMGQGYELTAKRKAAFILANRSASKVPAQSGKVMVEIRRGDSTVTEKVELEWQARGTFTDEFKNLKSMSFDTGIDYDMLAVENKYSCSGESRIKIPADATVIMKDPFTAYYYPSLKGNIGYLRIPHYSFPDANVAFKQYEYAINLLEKNTVGLVIDQDHNCGGSIEFLHQMMTLLMTEPFAPLQFQLMASKASYQSFAKWMINYRPYTIELDENKKVIELIKDTWLNSDDYLTKKTSISGEELRYPNHIHYTKPIIVLIDEMSGSGGDAFPALMGGYGRAKLLGTRTMGAGGHVEAITPLTNSQVRIDMTKSMFFRPDGVPVENNGAVPHIPYKHTLNDFKYGYLEYQKFYTDKILEMIP